MEDEISQTIWFISYSPNFRRLPGGIIRAEWAIKSNKSENKFSPLFFFFLSALKEK